MRCTEVDEFLRKAEADEEEEEESDELMDEEAMVSRTMWMGMREKFSRKI